MTTLRNRYDDWRLLLALPASLVGMAAVWGLVLAGIGLRTWWLAALALFIGAAIPYAMLRYDEERMTVSFAMPILGFVPAMILSEVLAHSILSACLYG